VEVPVDVKDQEAKASFYSKEWTRVWGIASVPAVDVVVYNKTLLLIKFPFAYFTVIGFLIGTFFYNIPGAIVGTLIGTTVDRMRRQRLRGSWLGEEDVLISAKYEKYAYLKVLMDDLNERVRLKEKNAIEVHNGKKAFVFKTRKKERERFESYVQEQSINLEKIEKER